LLRPTSQGSRRLQRHDGTKLYISTLRTLSSVFPSVHLYPSGEGEVITVVTATPAPDQKRSRMRLRLQQRHNFRYPMPQLLAPPAMPSTGNGLLTDDFAPVDILDTSESANAEKMTSRCG
jgi:hypothetical protein